MKKILFAFFTMLTICSCGDVLNLSEPDGKWTPMKWEKTDYRVVKENNETYYYVPAEGGTYTFVCKNYKGFWLADTFYLQDDNQKHWLDGRHDNPDGEYDWFHYANEWIDINTKDDNSMLKVVFQPNTGSVRKVFVGVTAGDIFYTFQFIQDANK